ncbi:MAG: lysophospholipid acyltransferase family protein [Prevotellaceae bacterium]|jgi:KDO2-lipid IV(A) lauroyltransferase|nr:lysophospholipid acyltransferase family protein [Prevotellaceae bacterium]
MKKCIFYLLYGLLYPVSLLPLRVHYVFSNIFYFFVYRIVGYRKSTIYINLARSFPHLKYKEIEVLASKFYRHFADLAAEMIWYVAATPKQLAKRVRLEDAELLKAHYEHDRSVLLLSGHLGNWEYFLSTSVFADLGWAGYPKENMAMVYKELTNAVMEKFFYSVRKKHRFGALVESKQVARFIAKHRREPWLYALVADQSPPPGSRYCVDFLHQKTLMMNGPEQLARMMNCAVAYYKMNKVGRGRYLITVQHICNHPDELAEGEITLKYVKLLESNIYEQPDIWLWSHRRWKRDVEKEIRR